MPDTKTFLTGQKEQGMIVFDRGKQYFILGRNRILISEHFADGEKTLEELLEAAILHTAKRSVN